MKILRYAVPYWVYACLNILFNVLAVLFSLCSFAVFIPVLEMLFHQMAIPKSAPAIDWSDFNTLKDNFYFHFREIYPRTWK